MFHTLAMRDYFCCLFSYPGTFANSEYQYYCFLLMQALAEQFLAMKPCCLDSAFSLPLHDMTDHYRDLLQGGQYYSLVKASFQGINTNVSVENTFARLKSMSRAGRGKNYISHTLCSKHLLAEVKKHHSDHADHLLKIKLKHVDGDEDPSDQMQLADDTAGLIGWVGLVVLSSEW